MYLTYRPSHQAWRIADDELAERQAAEEWLKREDPKASEFRDDIMRLYGSPASFIRPEGNAPWVACGIVAALTFTLLGWHNWYVLPPSHTATLLIVLNLLTILLSTLILHLGFFGRLLALYNRNLLRVQYLTRLLKDIGEHHLDAWWNCRCRALLSSPYLSRQSFSYPGPHPNNVILTPPHLYAAIGTLC